MNLIQTYTFLWVFDSSEEQHPTPRYLLRVTFHSLPAILTSRWLSFPLYLCIACLRHTFIEGTHGYPIQSKGFSPMSLDSIPIFSTVIWQVVKLWNLFLGRKIKPVWVTGGHQLFSSSCLTFLENSIRLVPLFFLKFHSLRMGYKCLI